MKRRLKKQQRINREETFYHLINSFLAGFLVFLGSLTSGQGITFQNIGIALLSALIIAITKFKSFWETKLKRYGSKNKLVNFL